MPTSLTPLEDLTGDLFVNRYDELDLFWNWATGIPHPLRGSRSLIGLRRTGKTAILIKLFNRLFYEQERVVPIYISFAEYLGRKKPITARDFARMFFTSYVASYLAFQYRQPLWVRRMESLTHFHTIAQQVQDEFVLDLYERYEYAWSEPRPHGVVQWVINMPRAEAAIYETPMAVIIDEFQVLTNVQFNNPNGVVHHDITDSFQRAAESHWAPLLVSGSAVSLLVEEALGGMLSGRFKYRYLGPLAREHAHDLVFRLGQSTGVTVTEEVAEAIWQLTDGYPYSIGSLMFSDCPARRHLPALDALEAIVKFELTDQHGELRQHYHREFLKYSQQLNAGQITRKVMLWATKYPDQRIAVEHMAQEIGVTTAEVHTALERLQWVDVVERVGLLSYKGPTDPMLRRFIEYQHYTEIEPLRPEKAQQDWETEFKRLQGHTNDLVGKLAEVYVGAVMRAFDGRTVDGDTYFSQAAPVVLPVFETLERRGGRVKEGVPIEIDLTGEWTLPDGQDVGAWLVQVRFTKKPMGPTPVRDFLSQTDAVVAEKRYASVTRWYFCKSGYTTNGAKALEAAGVLYSDRAQFNALAQLFDFFGLPA